MTRERLLVLDDEATFSSYLQVFGEDLGFHVVTTGSGSDFMEVYPVFQPDVIVLDLHLPDSNGFEIIRWLVRESCAARLLVCSGADHVFLKAARVLGESKGLMSVQLLAKPVLPDQLRAALRPLPD